MMRGPHHEGYLDSCINKLHSSTYRYAVPGLDSEVIMSVNREGVWNAKSKPQVKSCSHFLPPPSSVPFL